MTIDDIALSLHRGLGAKVIARLVDHFGSATEVYAAGESALVELGVKRNIAQAIATRSTHAEAEAEQQTILRRGLGVVAYGDELYPRMLREVADRPHLIYYMGDISIMSRHTLAMVGTRNSTPYGTIMTDRIVEYLSSRMPGMVVVSGLAFGTDSNAHRAALRYGLPTAAIIPSPLPEIVPSEHAALARDIIAQGGVIISEYNSACRPTRNSFIARNRIIAGASEGTLVVESKATGGSMSTAEFALGYNRTLLALPGRATDIASAGTNKLIVGRQAAAVCSGEDVVREMYWDVEDKEVGLLLFDEPELSREQRGILSYLSPSDPISVDTLAERSGITAGELAIMLVDMELDGVVKRLPGDCYLRLR